MKLLCTAMWHLMQCIASTAAATCNQIHILNNVAAITLRVQRLLLRCCCASNSCLHQCRVAIAGVVSVQLCHATCCLQAIVKACAAE